MMNRRGLLQTAGGLVLSSLPITAFPRTLRSGFSFALIGDLPYSDSDEPRLAEMLADTDRDALSFVLHVGDIKASREPCSDALYARRKAIFERSAHPLVLLAGDNEWTDCHRSSAGGYDPRERLVALRETFWSKPGTLGGSAAANGALSIERQPGYPENARWRIGDVHFVALHVVGSNNGLGEYPGSVAEFEHREAANRRWLDEAMELARRHKADALVLAMHANPEFGRSKEKGFDSIKQQLMGVAHAFTQPILLLHGDSHTFRVDQPLRDAQGRTLEHFTRVECFGFPRTGSWVRISYDPNLATRFTVAIRDVPIRTNG